MGDVLGESGPRREPEADPRTRLVTASEARRRAFGDDPAGGDHCHPVGQELCLVHVVGSEQDGFAQLGQALHDLPGLAARRGVEAGRRLVKEEQLGIADQRHPDVEAPLLAA